MMCFSLRSLGDKEPQAGLEYTTSPLLCHRTRGPFSLPDPTAPQGSVDPENSLLTSLQAKRNLEKESDISPETGWLQDNRVERTLHHFCREQQCHRFLICHKRVILALTSEGYCPLRDACKAQGTQVHAAAH